MKRIDIEKEVLKEVIKRDFTVDYKELLLEDEILEKIIEQSRTLDDVPCMYLYMDDNPEKARFSKDLVMLNEEKIGQIGVEFMDKCKKNKVSNKHTFYDWKKTELVCSFKKTLEVIKLYKDKEVKEEELAALLSALPQILVKRICKQAEYNITATKAVNSMMSIKDDTSEKKEEILIATLYYYIDNRIAEKPQCEPFPEELKTPEAKKIFDAAIKAGYMEKATDRDGYKWKKSKALLAYFGVKLNLCLKLNAGTYTNKNGVEVKKISWKPIEIAFNVKDLKGTKYGYSKNGNKKPDFSKNISD